ncbi:MAG: noeI [Solirubrobacterales bacterium]|nr:noeI [Solirubrobacterales bacterium]
MDKNQLKAYARRVRDHRIAGRIVRFPFARLMASGVSVPRSISHHLPYTGEFVTRCPDGGEFRMDSRGDLIESLVYWDGVFAHDAECIAAWIELARSSRVVLDVGANTGLYSLIAGGVSPGCQVHAFEPLGRVADRLRLNAALNPSFDIVAHQRAVGAVSGTATIYDPGGTATNCYSASLNPEFMPGVQQESYDVEVVALDEFVTSHQLPSVDLIKIDVEGFEEYVLDGLTQTIQRFRPAILMEFLTDENPRVKQHIVELMANGYALLHLSPEGAHRAHTASKPAVGQNVLLLPEERPLATVPVLEAVA